MQIIKLQAQSFDDVLYCVIAENGKFLESFNRLKDAKKLVTTITALRAKHLSEDLWIDEEEAKSCW